MQGACCCCPGGKGAYLVFTLFRAEYGPYFPDGNEHSKEIMSVWYVASVQMSLHDPVYTGPLIGGKSVNKLQRCKL